MASKLNPARSPARISSQSLQKIILTQKNLSRSPPRLWLDHPSYEQTHQDQPILTLTHPILQKLESICTTSLKQFNQVHAQLLVSDLFQHPLASSRVLKKLCDSSLPTYVAHAVKIFECVNEPDSFLCNTIIRGYLKCNDLDGGLGFYYVKMVGGFIWPNHYTFPLVVKVCADLGLVREGEKAHTWVIKLGIELDLYVRNSLIHMYALCGRLWDARMLFDLSTVSDVVTWNTMIDGCVKNGELGFARWLFDGMKERDVFSWNSMIGGYVGVGNMETAKELFDKMPCRDFVSWNCMIDGYARVGNVVMAREFFDWMPCPNVVAWNTMLALYVRSKDYNGCLGLFDKIMEADCKPNTATLMSVLIACAHLRRLDKGEWLHAYIKNSNKVVPDVLLSTALLTMYAKCGAMDLAKNVFDDMPDKSVVSWNSMIMGYGMHGYGEKALEMFLAMAKSGMLPNDATFMSILGACKHAGMVLEGWWYFDLMCRVYEIEPKVEHCGCMVDLLGLVGLVKDSEEINQNMSFEVAAPGLWQALLSACRTSNLELREIVAKRLIQLEPGDIGAYALLLNIYASEGRWDDVETVRETMTEKGLHILVGPRIAHSGDCGTESFAANRSLHKKTMVYFMLSEMGAQMKLS